jgi:hypothetical protein
MWIAHVVFQQTHFTLSPTAFASAAVVQGFVIHKDAKDSPSGVYKYAKSVSITSAASTVSPRRMFFKGFARPGYVFGAVGWRPFTWLYIFVF